MKLKAFTLIEVLVALSIVSIGLIALVKTESQQSLNLERLERKTIANLVVSNLSRPLSIKYTNSRCLFIPTRKKWTTRTPLLNRSSIYLNEHSKKSIYLN